MKFSDTILWWLRLYRVKDFIYIKKKQYRLKNLLEIARPPTPVTTLHLDLHLWFIGTARISLFPGIWKLIGFESMENQGQLRLCVER